MKSPAIKLTDKDEARIRGELKRGDCPHEVAKRNGIKLQRLRRVACGPLFVKSWAIEAIQKR